MGYAYVSAIPLTELDQSQTYHSSNSTSHHLKKCLYLSGRIQLFRKLFGLDGLIDWNNKSNHGSPPRFTLQKKFTGTLLQPAAHVVEPVT
jgi:hypothetical protein